MQRFFDIIFSSIAILVLSPILLICILILKLTGEGEIFYLQERNGLKGNKFKLFKFATMVKNSEKSEQEQLLFKMIQGYCPLENF